MMYDRRCNCSREMKKGREIDVEVEKLEGIWNGEC